MSKEYILDWNDYISAARDTVAEGMVLVENNGVLPLKKDSRVAIFGRIQTHYYKSGTGSGGMVNVDKVIGIPDGLKNSGQVTIDEELQKVYEKWEESNPFDEGQGWGTEPWCQEEMPLDDELVKYFASKNDVAIAIIGRTAGEDRDSSDGEGSYRLTAVECDMLAKLRKHFANVVVLLNVGGIIDMSFVDIYKPDAVMYVWQGGMVGGDGTADVLVGNVSPSGKLPDTIAYNVTDYLSDENFGNEDCNFYAEDIFVGYRYFETFAKDKVRYPFGYGLSYTNFSVKPEVRFDGLVANIKAEVTNVGKFAGKEVVQVYIGAPNGKLGKAKKVLAAFAKTEKLEPGESQTLNIKVDLRDFASYDDVCETIYPHSFVLEAGVYKVYVGCDVASAKECENTVLSADMLVEKLESALYPVRSFERYVAKGAVGGRELVKQMLEGKEPLEDERRLQNIKNECISGLDYVPTLEDVYNNKARVEDLVANLTDDDLCSIVRGEGMGSSRVTAGTASSFAGANDRLMKDLKVPCICCDDGPSGMRLDSGVKAFSLPNGTLISSTFNPELVTKLYTYTGIEMIANKVDCLLGPGLNIHRHPLNGRNFEYFSEDPYLTGVMGTAILEAFASVGVSGTIKHFCANNQEKKRHFIDSVVSERALREIYLKPFEMCVKSGYANSIMTTYGSVNGLWTCGNYDLNMTILRKQWGYEGVVMSDWWAMINRRNQAPNHNDFAQMVRAQNDLYMVCSDSSKNSMGDNLEASLKDGTLMKAELEMCAVRILNFALNTHAMKRIVNDETKVTVLNKPKSPDDVDMSDITYTLIDGKYVFDLTVKDSVAGTNYILPVNFAKIGLYKVTVTASSNMSLYSQNPCTLFSTGSPVGTFSFRGSGDQATKVEREIYFYSRFSILRLFVLRNGVSLKTMEFEYIGE